MWLSGNRRGEEGNRGELVACHSGFTYAERPLEVTWEGQHYKIVQILAQWRSPEGRHFRVCTSNGQEFVLSYREVDNEWQITQL